MIFADLLIKNRLKVDGLVKSPAKFYLPQYMVYLPLLLYQQVVDLLIQFCKQLV